MIKIKKHNNDTGYVLPNASVQISGGNKIVRRNISKNTKGGTVKERWSTDDFKLTFSGVIIGKKVGVYPKKEVQKLLNYVRHEGNLLLTHSRSNALGITAIAVESFNLPQTNGSQNQEFSFVAFSDERFQEVAIENK